MKLPSIRRRVFLQSALAAGFLGRISAAVQQERLDAAAEALETATTSGLVTSAVIYVNQREFTFTRAFGKAGNDQAMFLLGSISKPIAMTALMTLYDKQQFGLDDAVRRYLPQFTGDGRDAVTIRQLLTHTSGLPDQLPENDRLRKSHAPLSAFVEAALRTPLNFAAGERYQYSSMGILLAAHIAERISGTNILEFVDKSVLKPLKMTRSAQGLGSFKLEDFVPCQTEKAAPESGGGDPTAKQWDWNSRYWRELGAPWGGTHASAPDVGRLLSEFHYRSGLVLKTDTSRLMIDNHNRPGLPPRGLAWNVGTTAGTRGCSELTFGHTGSTGTIGWADPSSQTICVVLTSLPGRAVPNHPRQIASEKISAR